MTGLLAVYYSDHPDLTVVMKRAAKFKLKACLAVVAASCLWQFVNTAVLALPAAVPASRFEDGVKLYNQKQYKQALPVFLEFLKQNPRSPSAYLYIANSYYGLNQVSAAKQTYQILIRSFPYSSEAASAREFMRRLQPADNSAADAVDSANGSKTGSATSSASESKQSSSKNAASDASSHEISFRVIRPLQDHPVVSPALITAVKSQIENYPKNVRQLLIENRIEVVLTPTLIDKNPEMKNREGRGYDGYTLKSCPGMFQGGRSIVICERTMDESTEAVHDPIPTSHILRTLNHECGHAIDRCLGNICVTDDYKHNYLLDAAAAQRLDASVSRDLAYYLQKSVAGQQECCGELFGIILGTEDEKSEKMKAAFPQTIKFLKAKLGV
ncbi:MAG TPA: tetratricopeptide repeat protein [Drouetiella sp.]|jgi:tetratricopeptide (TPR) repeat protein